MRPVIVFLLVLALPWPAYAHTTGSAGGLFFVFFMQLVAGPGFILLADAFKGARIVCLIAFVPAVVLAWALEFAGYPAGISEAVFNGLVASLDGETAALMAEVLFVANLVGFPVAAAALLWVICTVADLRRARAGGRSGQEGE